MRLEYRVENNELVIELLRDDDQGDILESLVRIPAHVISELAAIGSHSQSH